MPGEIVAAESLLWDLIFSIIQDEVSEADLPDRGTSLQSQSQFMLVRAEHPWIKWQTRVSATVNTGLTKLASLFESEDRWDPLVVVRGNPPLDLQWPEMDEAMDDVGQGSRS